MKKSFLKPLLLAALAFVTLSSCSDDHDTIPQKEPTYDMTGFAKGADVSWLTQMQASGKKFYNSNGTEQDCMSLLRDLGSIPYVFVYGLIPQTDGATRRICSLRHGMRRILASE